MLIKHRVHQRNLCSTSPCLGLGWAWLKTSKATSTRQTYIANIWRLLWRFWLIQNCGSTFQCSATCFFHLPKLLQRFYNINWKTICTQHTCIVHIKSMINNTDIVYVLTWLLGPVMISLHRLWSNFPSGHELHCTLLIKTLTCAWMLMKCSTEEL